MLLDHGPDDVVVDGPVVVGDAVAHAFDEAPWHGWVQGPGKVAMSER